MVRDHLAHELFVELVRRLQDSEIGRVVHHASAHHAEAMEFTALRDLRPVPGEIPAPHVVYFATLVLNDPLSQISQVGMLGPINRQFRHFDRIVMMRDHLLDEVPIHIAHRKSLAVDEPPHDQ